MCGSWGGCLTKSCAAIFAACRALIFPARKTSGILPVDVMAAGRRESRIGKGGCSTPLLTAKRGCISTTKRFKA